jgi:HK97 family phage portal protein
MPTSFLSRLQRAYAALGKAADTTSPLYRFNPQLATREHLTAGTTSGGAEIDRYAAHARVYRQYVWVRKAITAITTALAPLPLRVVDADGTAIADHPLTMLLRKPNGQMDGPELYEIMLIHKLLGGEWFLEVVDDARGQPAELWPRRPDEVWVVGDPTQPGYPIPVGYQIPSLDPPFIPVGSMIHEMFANPLNPWRGISVIGAARDEIAVDLAVLLNTQRAVTDGTRQYAITTDEALTPEERARAEAQLEARYGRHRPMLLESGQSIAAFGSAPDDLEWLKARDYSREAIGALFGVPDEIMGFGRDTYENFDTAYRVFWMLTLWPMAQRRDATFTHFFSEVRPLLAPGQRIATDIRSVDVLQDALGPKLEQAKMFFAMGVPYNVIEALLNLGTGPIPGGDIGYLSTSLTPASDLNMAAPSAPQQTTAHGVQVKTADAQRIARVLQRIRRQATQRVEPLLAAEFAALADLVAGRAEALRSTVERSKDLRQLPIDDLIRFEDFVGMLDTIQLGIVDVASASWEVWNVALAVDLAFDANDPAVVAALRSSAQRIQGIFETTREAVRELLQYGAQNAWTIDQLVDGTDERPGLRALVAETYSGRHRTIARTELGTAQNEVAADRYRRAGVTRVLILDNGFEDSDPRCSQLNGTVQTVEWFQANPLQHPNCVRAASPLVE